MLDFGKIKKYVRSFWTDVVYYLILLVTCAVVGISVFTEKLTIPGFIGVVLWLGGQGFRWARSRARHTWEPGTATPEALMFMTVMIWILEIGGAVCALLDLIIRF